MYKVYWISLSAHTDIALEGYVGITNDFPRRMREHKSKDRGYHLSNAIRKYQWANLSKDVVASGLSLHEALSLEKVLRPRADIGWNTLAGGGNGSPHSDEVKDKISKSMIGNTNSKGFDDVALVCPYCGKGGQKAAMLRWHFNNCKEGV